MDTDRFDHLTYAFSLLLSRRTIASALGLGTFGLPDLVEAKKKHKRKKKKKKTCKGSTKKCGKTCIPQNECCGGCADDSLCDAGVCQPCTVTCVSGVPTVCGADLQVALAAGGTVYVCPGRYQENFTLDAAVRVLGAGDGAGVATDTILTANGFGRVLQINPGAGLVALERLRITGGSADSGGGINHEGTTLRLTDCTVSGNSANDAGGIHASSSTTLEMTRCTVRDNEAIAAGGGIVANGNATLTDCLVEANSADNGGGIVTGGPTALAGSTQVRGNAAEFGGGILVVVSSLIIAETCRVTENTADAGQGGGIAKFGFGLVTLQGADPSPIVVNNCHENCGGLVAKCAATPVSC
jgi:hypothetical protein